MGPWRGILTNCSDVGRDGFSAAEKCKRFNVDDSKRKRRRQQGDWPIALKKRHRKQSAPLCFPPERGKEGRRCVIQREQDRMKRWVVRGDKVH